MRTHKGKTTSLSWFDRAEKLSLGSTLTVKIALFSLIVLRQDIFVLRKGRKAHSVLKRSILPHPQGCFITCQAGKTYVFPSWKSTRNNDVCINRADLFIKTFPQNIFVKSLMYTTKNKKLKNGQVH